MIPGRFNLKRSRRIKSTAKKMIKRGRRLRNQGASELEREQTGNRGDRLAVINRPQVILYLVPLPHRHRHVPNLPTRAEKGPSSPPLSPLPDAQLIHSPQYMDRRVYVHVQANRGMSGVLRGYDMFLNLVLEQAFEELGAGERKPCGTAVSHFVLLSSRRDARGHGAEENESSRPPGANHSPRVERKAESSPSPDHPWKLGSLPRTRRRPKSIPRACTDGRAEGIRVMIAAGDYVYDGKGSGLYDLGERDGRCAAIDR